MKKVILIGTVGCGKTTLSQALMGENISYKKTQAVEVVGQSILDTPGEYLEFAQMRGALMTTSADADVVGLLQSATEERNMFSPAYAGTFAKEVFGVITKIDCATEEQIASAEAKLKMAGAQRIFKISSVTGEGLDELIEYLNE